MNHFALEMKNIVKSFGNVKALSKVNFSVKKGTIHALCGENGAGKSTLMKILSGFYPNDSYEGEIFIDNLLQNFSGTIDSENAGIAIIYQELALVKEMTVCENIFLGHEITKGLFIDWDLAYSKTKDILKEVKLNVNPSAKVSSLGVGEQQLVEIAKAIAKNANILILDEPTAALTEIEANNLLEIIKELRVKGKTCIYISHRLKEVFQIADHITILRDGRTISSDLVKELNEEKLISKMVGRELTNIFPREKREFGKTIFKVKNWTVLHPETGLKVIDNVSFQINKGEIIGISGLMGAGRTELAMSIFGAWGKVTSGELFIEGKKVTIQNESDAIESGLALVSEDRKRFGLVLGMDIKENTTLSSIEKISNYGFMDKNKEIFSTRKFVGDLKIKTNTIEQFVGNLSGGNQQKVVLSKWLMTKPKILILDEPTRGIDVGAKSEIYNIMNQLLDQGILCIIMISSELPEILGMSDRILVMHNGKISGDILQKNANQETIMQYATGHLS
ncbi:xylose ABC transporter ATP-binding protein [Silvanigrella paludirubra]|uniref:Xylose ABC transporter ATP-binding protein n=1 Tax=Silvanigrella paludirubra TaxID=2499159 RepID=A0A6N6VTZ8_9BACT|nr:xylose ABC transporter ATP-binding protein [Silvanigrella paludirubra]KAB8039541.1 xylose ABC transporter ATP-binding protein [Silvanigrella paludirubra]